jgi:arabinoxylan arabinofuranohydrolase
MIRRSTISSLLLLVSTTLIPNRPLFADNPIIQTKYSADPAPLVYDGTLYLYTSHDEDNATGFTMYNYLLYSTTDMVNWTDHGILAGVKDPYKTWKWADGNNAWAPQVIFRNNKFYMYAPFPKGGRMVIGVATSDKPTGPFVDAIGAPLVDDPTSNGLDIDPTVFIDTDGQAYLYFGHQPYFYYVKLNQDMVSYSGDIVRFNKVGTFEEGPWLWALDGRWYLAWASTCCPEGIGYAMADKPTGPWTFKGSIMDGDQRSSGNHPGIVQYQGNWYVFGFNYTISYPQSATQALPGGHTEQRSVCVEKFSYAADGTIPKLPWWTTTGAPQLGTLNPYVQTEAETIAFSKGLKTETCGEGGMDVTAIENGDYIKVKGVDFGAGATSLEVRVASAGSGGSIEVHLDSQTGTLVGTCAVAGTGGAQNWATKSCAVSGASGVHDLFFVFTGGSGSLFNFNWWKFSGSGPGIDGGAPGTGGSTGSDGGSAPGGAGGSGAGGGGRSGADGAAGADAGSGGGGGRTGSGGVGPAGAGGAGLGGKGGSQTGNGGAGPTGSGGSGTGGKGDAQSGSSGAGGTTAASGSGGSGVTRTGGSAGTGGSGGSLGSVGGAGPATGDSASSGCSCEIGRASESSEGMLGLLLGLGLLAWRRGRRRRA